MRLANTIHFSSMMSMPPTSSALLGDHKSTHVSIPLPYFDRFEPTSSLTSRTFKCTEHHYVVPIDETVFIYSFPTFDLVHSLRHRSRITDCDIYLDLLVTSCDDDTVYAWNLASGRCIYVIHDFPDTGIVYSATFSVTIGDTEDPSVGGASSRIQGVMQTNSVRIVVWRQTFLLPLFWICEVSLIKSCAQEVHEAKVELRSHAQKNDLNSSLTLHARISTKIPGSYIRCTATGISHVPELLEEPSRLGALTPL